MLATGEDFQFGVQPILHGMAVVLTTLEIQFVRAFPNSFRETAIEMEFEKERCQRVGPELAIDVIRLLRRWSRSDPHIHSREFQFGGSNPVETVCR